MGGICFSSKSLKPPGAWQVTKHNTAGTAVWTKRPATKTQGGKNGGEKGSIMFVPDR